MVKLSIEGENIPMDTQLAPLQDRFGRKIDYLRLSVTDRCDLRCSYCMPKSFKGFEEPGDWLTFDEIERVVGIFVRMGTTRVRLTGGEPLLRRHLSTLAGRLSQLPGLSDLSLSTNGTQLVKHAEALYKAGVRRLNISMDTLSRDCMIKITGRDSMSDVMAGLDIAQTVGFAPIKLNMVVMPEINLSEVQAMAEFCINRGLILRLIETMPVGSTGLASGYTPLGPVVESLRQRLDLIPEIKVMGGGPARYWRTRDGNGQIGVITPMSQHFCETCNRLRMSVDGTLYLCLGEDAKVELRPYLRNGATDADIEQILREAIELKPERHHFNEIPEKIVRFMSQTGG